MDGPRIVLAGAREVVISGAQDDGDGVGQSATVHGLTDDMVEAGVPLADALAELLEALAGRAMLAHFATIEEDFLSAACRSVFGAGLVGPHPGHLRPGAAPDGTGLRATPGRGPAAAADPGTLRPAVLPAAPGGHRRTVVC
jgi:hypothetical protein